MCYNIFLTVVREGFNDAEETLLIDEAGLILHVVDHNEEGEKLCIKRIAGMRWRVSLHCSRKPLIKTLFVMHALMGLSIVPTCKKVELISQTMS